MIRPGIRRLFRLPRRGAAAEDAGVEEEIRLHLELRAEQLQREGLTPDRARAEAARRFGPLDEARRTLRRAATRRERRMRVRERLSTVGQDLRYGVRQLRRDPTFAAIAILTLALGIGANGAVFGVVHHALLRPLPYAEPDRLTMVWETIPSEGILENTPAPITLDRWRREAASFASLAPFTVSYTNLTGGDEPERLRALRASAELLPTLGIGPALGRGFTGEEDRYGGPTAVLLSDALWRRRFGGDPAVVGSSIRLDGEAVRVAGVLPPEVPLPIGSDVWIPLAFSPEEVSSESRMLWVVGRLRDGVSLEAAQAELDARMDGARSSLTYGIGARVEALDEALRGEVRADLLLVFAVTGAVLLIACANVATMMLARSTGRRRELAVRSAIGASRARIARQLALESLVFAACAGAVGLLLALLFLRAIAALAPPLLSSSLDAGLDPRALAFTAAVSLGTVLLFGLAPLLSGVRTDPAEIRSGTRSVDPGGRRPVRAALVVGEVALAVVLLAGAGLLLRGLVRVLATPTGFDAAGVLTLQVERTDEDPARRLAFFDELLRSVAALPEVRAAGVSNGIPIRFAGGGSGFTTEEAPDAVVSGNHRIVSGGYFAAMGIPLLAGRTFDDAGDRAGSERVAVVSRLFAARSWGEGVDPVGRRFLWGAWSDEARWITVVGVVGDVRLRRTADASPHVYFPYAQVDEHWSFAPRDLAVRSRGDPVALGAEIRRIVAAMDPDQPVANVLTMERILSDSMGQRRFVLYLLAGFAALALALAVAGVYGVLSYLVGRHTREIGVRLAIGATAAQVRRGVLRIGVRLVGGGALVGLAAAVPLVRWGSGRIPGLDSADPLVLAGSAALLVAVGLLACDVPARRAARLDPARVLRAD